MQTMCFNYIVSFICGGNRSTRRKPPTCRESLNNPITECCFENTSPWAGYELTTLVVIFTDCICSCKSSYHTITTMMVPINNVKVTSGTCAKTLKQRTSFMIMMIKSFASYLESLKIYVISELPSSCKKVMYYIWNVLWYILISLVLSY